ncbi:MAG: hypothetical protein IPL78_22245 [Chloroflexi bacterium]|nr:hypothetical protein [Chloroflexota bacterium]
MSQPKKINKPNSEKPRPVRRKKSQSAQTAEEPSNVVYQGGTPESQINTLGQLSRPQQQTALRHIGKVQGNRRAAQVVAKLQRHPGHGALNTEQEQLVESTAANLQRQPAPGIMRAELLQDGHQTAIVSPLEFGNVPLLSAPRADAPQRGNLAARDMLTVLRRDPNFVYVQVKSGDLTGQHGYVPFGKIIISPAAAPTSLRTPTAGTENAYTQLQTELAKPTPNRIIIFLILEQRMTVAQQQRLLRPGNVEWKKITELDNITADDVLNLLSLLGSSLKRRLTEYTEWGGRNVAKLRLAFASAAADERVDVARDDALIGELRPILGGTHPEIIFGHHLEQVYPPDGTLKTLRATHPNLAQWLRRFVSARTNLQATALDRSTLLTDALIEIGLTSARRAKRKVMRAIYRAPRGMAMSATERSALDRIAIHAYNESSYSSANLGVMFLTRFGRPLLGAARHPKTFIYRLWQALQKLPDDNVMLNNVLTSFDLNKDPTAAGSFTHWLGSKDFGKIRSDLPVAAETVHADGNQRGRSIKVREPHIDLFKRKNKVTVTQANGTTTELTIRWVNSSRRRLGLSQRVNVSDGAAIVPTGTASSWERGTAMRIQTATRLMADSGGLPDLEASHGTLQPGVMVSKYDEAPLGAEQYFKVKVLKGGTKKQIGWILASSVTGMGMSAREALFEWTLRHEMGHALDLQINGFSQFSAPSVAQWRKYTGAADWVSDLIRTAAIASPGVNRVFNRINLNFRQAAIDYSEAVQSKNSGSAKALVARNWLRGWVAAGGSQAVYDTITQYNADPWYYSRNNEGLPVLSGRIFGAHYYEWYSAAAAARTQSLAAGVSPYAYTCTYEFFADHYAAYTGPGSGGQTYARAVPIWAQDFFDRLVGRSGAGPRVGMKRHRMDKG